MSKLQQNGYQTLQIDYQPQQAQIVTVRLNRPNKKNAMSFQMIKELLAVAEQIKGDKKIRAVILTGSVQSFCSGLDLGDLNNPKNQAFALWELIKPWQSDFQRVCLVWRELPIPVIVAMQGYCLGAGLQLALGADIRISSPDCQLAIMETKWGLVADMGLTQSALGVVRADVLKELAMSARIIDAPEAERLGLITHISQDPVAHAQSLAIELANRSPDAVLASKRIVNRMYAQSPLTLYQEKFWQLKLMLGKNRKKSLQRAKDASISYALRQFK